MTKFYVCTSNSLSTPDGVKLPGEAFDSAEAGLTKGQCARLVKAGRISQEIERGRFTMHGQRTMPPEQTFDAPLGHKEPKDQEPNDGEIRPPATRPPKKWQFTDEQLTGKNLTELNGMISERGGAPQASIEEAIVLLQSELD